MKWNDTFKLVLLCVFLISSISFAQNDVWTYGVVQGDIPLGRIGHSAVHDYDTNRMIVFAGRHLNQTIGDLWQLDDSSLTWTQLFPQNDGPFQLRNHAAVYNPNDSSMVLYGGVEYPGGYISDELWVLNLNTLIWTEIEPSGFWPPPTRCNYATYWAEENKMVMFGGRTHSTRYNQTWLLDLDTFMWELVNYQNTPPAPREASPILILQGTATLMIYGGYLPGPEYMDELWTLELLTGMWTQHFPDEPHPIARGYCPLLYDKDCDRVLLFGGLSAYPGPGLNDLWQISLDSMQYTELFPTGAIPSPRGGFSTIIGFAGHKATIFGGTQNYQYYYSDLYFLDWDCMVAVIDEQPLPEREFIASCYPNPFNASTSIKFNLSSESEISISVYNIIGQKIDTPFRGTKQIGEHSVVWNADDFPSGVYFARLETGESSKNIKMLLLK